MDASNLYTMLHQALPQYPQYPPRSHSFMSATSYPPVQPPSQFMQPTFHMPQQQFNYGYIQTFSPMQDYAGYVPSPVGYHVPSPVGYHVPVGYVDETAIIFVSDQTFDEYEDMLQLQEQIGHVNVGLSVETIFKNLKTSRISAVNEEEEEGEVCAVCQEEYKINDTIGTLECRHKYHANCIKEWLLHKNVCPVCKSTALVDLVQ